MPDQPEKGREYRSAPPATAEPIAPAKSRVSTERRDAFGVSVADIRAIAKDAYIYGFPLVDNYRIQHAYFVDRGNPEFKTTWNQVFNNARVYTPDDTAVQSPNSDTPYSYVGADLRAEPLVLTVPPIEKSRYFSLQFIDAYTFNFAYVGSRTTGNDGGNFLLAGPRWKGETPAGVKRVFRSETEFCFVLYRTQLFEPNDIENVKKIQAGYRVQSLSAFLGKPHVSAPNVKFIKPLTPEQQRKSPEFFNILNFVLQFCPTHPSEQELMARFAKIGVGPAPTFNAGDLSPEDRKAVEDGMADAWAAFGELKKSIDTGKPNSADAFGTREFLKNNYLYRMGAAVLGIYGNSKDEAFYPTYHMDADGKALDGSKRYRLTFAEDQLPPANAFWSLTMYELPASLLTKNPLNRYLINSPMLPGLTRDADGGLTIFIQSESPGKENESNWLPAPQGPFFLALRLYWPKPAAFDGTWRQPALKEVEEGQAAAGTTTVSAGEMPVPVTVDNFRRAESDMYFASAIKQAGGIGQVHHNREVMPIDSQSVIRANRDTLYSSAVFDLAAGPVTVTLPDAGKRFMSLQVIDEDQYAPTVMYAPGSVTLTKEQVGTRYVMVGVRTLVDPNNPSDIDQAHALQDAMKVSQTSPGRFEVPNWDRVSQKRVHDALLVLGASIQTKRMFGSRSSVDPVRHLIGTAMGWGGNPENEATYIMATPSKNDGKTIHRLSVKDVPVDGFWSISVYNAAGYFEKNSANAYSINNITAKPNADGSISVQFGGCDGKVANCLPITPGWNYCVRLYRPRKEILDGTWTFAEARPVE